MGVRYEMYTPGGERPAVGKVRAYGSPIREGVEKVMVVPWFIKEGTHSNRQHGRFSGSIPGRAMSVQQRASWRKRVTLR